MTTRSLQKKRNSELPLDASASQDWRGAGSRNQRSHLIREALFKAAAEIVGDVGYQDASVTMITQRAGVAQGTFYNHFVSRQDIFDKLLPALGNDMLDHVRQCTRQGATLIEREELGFRGFFSFLKQTPHFFRILNEAESFAPNAYRAHLDLLSSGYIRLLRRASGNGELPGYEERELEVIAFVLMAARSYLAWRYVYGEEKHDDIPEWVVKTYVKLATYGLSGKPQKPSIQSKTSTRARSQVAPKA